MTREVDKRNDDLDGSEVTEAGAFALDGSLTRSTFRTTTLVLPGGRWFAMSAGRGAARLGWSERFRQERCKLAQDRAGPAGVRRIQLREWAGVNDVTAPFRGGIPQAILDQYKVAGRR